jgi:hypothetical protein
MWKHLALCFPLALAAAGEGYAQDKQAASYATMAPVAQYRIASPQDEIALARSAAPPSISADAEVLVLGSKGYESAVAGKNGFVCFVERSWSAGFEDPEFWNPALRAPNCFNPPAVRSVLPQFLKRTEWVLAGASKQQLIEKARTAFANHDFVAPEAGSLSFMLSKNGFLKSGKVGGPWLPHMMFFVPPGQAAAWGSGKTGSPVLGKDGSPSEPTVLYVPVPSWSDGTPAPSPAQHQTM